MQGNYTTKSWAETASLGEKFGSSLKGGELVLLYGELGSGKTQFTKGVARALGITETIVSPTFTIERVYKGSLSLHHFDLYRTKKDREILQEIQDLLEEEGNIIVVEWPENMSLLANLQAIKITFVYVDENERLIKIEEMQ